MGPKSKKPEDIVAALVDKDEDVLFWSGNFESSYMETRVSKLISKLISKLWRPVAFILLVASLFFRESEYTIWVYGILLGTLLLSLITDGLVRGLKRYWQHNIILTNRRIILRHQTIDGADISKIERDFGENGVLDYTLKTKQGGAHLLPPVDMDKLIGLINKHFLRTAT